MGIILLKIGLILLAYFLGSIPSGLIVGRYFKNIELHKEGSKNIGTSNAIRVLGLKLGILTLIMDVVKTVFVLVLVNYFLPNWISGFNTLVTVKNVEMNYAIIYGIFAVLGHIFSIFLNFGGGKAVASSFAVVLVLTPIPAIIGISCYVIIVLLIKYASIGSTVGATGVLISALIQFLIYEDDFRSNLIVFIAYCLMVLFIFIKHIPNFIRLFKGEEKKMYLFKKTKKKAL